jgi:hypothetical protein
VLATARGCRDARRLTEERPTQLLAPSRAATTATAADDNVRFMTDETQRQQQVMQAQDQSVDGLLTSVQGLNHVAVQISHEVKDQNKCVRLRGQRPAGLGRTGTSD